MRDEARNTDRHGTGWLSAPLRGQAVTFVSAGQLSREELPTHEPQQALENGAANSVAHEEAPNNQDPELPQVVGPPQPDAKLPEAVVEDDSETASFVELRADDSSRPRRTSISSASSDEIVFLGREKTPPKSHTLSPSGKGKNPLPRNGQSAAEEEYQPYSQTTVEVSIAAPKHPPISLRPRNGRRGRRGRPGRQTQLHSQFDEDEEAIMQDYIENLAMSDDSDAVQESPKHDWKRTEHYRSYAGAGEENQKVQTKPRAASQVPDEEAWESAELEDFDNVSTTDDEVVEVQKVIRKRRRPKGLQYLVHAKGAATSSDAKWIFHTNLTSQTALEQVEIFEKAEEVKLKNIEESLEDDIDEDSSSDEDDEVLDDIINQLESEDEENERILKRTEKMTDEEIARALQKQEELGLGGDDVMLFDGNDEDGFVKQADFLAFASSSPKSRRKSGWKGRRSAEEFPSASLFADVLDQDPYGAFDVMDFDRPSLKPKKKGRKGDLPFDIPDDPDLADQMRRTWAKDRDKKAIRKAQKLEARATAEAAVPTDSESIRNAIRSFLVDDNRSDLALPPMAPHIRAAVHRLAKCLSLRSDSKGKGDNRHPVLTKTPFTHHYTPDTIWEIDALINQRRFFLGSCPYKSSQRILRHGGAVPSRRTRDGGAGGTFAATYMEGEIVGASAPEIGEGNKGRAMLEKMGWSSGMGIGAVGNKGAIDVIQHKVKKTKAGLG